jgi:hypothetical protein
MFYTSIALPNTCTCLLIGDIISSTPKTLLSGEPAYPLLSCAWRGTYYGRFLTLSLLRRLCPPSRLPSWNAPLLLPDLQDIPVQGRCNRLYRPNRKVRWVPIVIVGRAFPEWHCAYCRKARFGFGRNDRHYAHRACLAPCGNMLLQGMGTV